MNNLSENFSQILSNISDYKEQLSTIQKIFNETIDDLINKNFLGIDFLEESKKYPKYPIDFKAIHNINKYNLLSIYNIISDNADYLLDKITSPDISSLKNDMDLLPDKDIKRDVYLQTCFFMSLSKEYFDETIFRGLIADNERRSYLYKTFGYQVSQELKTSSLIFHYSVYLAVLRNMPSILRIFNNIDIGGKKYYEDNDTIINSFKNYLYISNKPTPKLRNMAEALVRFLLYYTYEISSPSGSFINDMISIIEKKLMELGDIFDDGISDLESVMSLLVSNVCSYYYNHFAGNFSNDENRLEYVSDDSINNLSRYEKYVFETIMSKCSLYNMNEFYFLAFYRMVKFKLF